MFYNKMIRFIILVLLLCLSSPSWSISDTIGNNHTILDQKMEVSSDTNGINRLFDLYYKFRKSDPSLALHYLQRAQLIATTIDDKEKTALVLYHKGYLYRMIGIYDLAIKSYVASLTYYETTGNKSLEAWLLIDIGNLYFIQKDKMLHAIEHYEKANKLFAEIEDGTQGMIVAENNIGLVYKEQKEFVKAIPYFFDAVKLCDKIKDTEDKILALSYIGQAYVSRHELDSAKIYFDKVFQLSSDKKLKEWIACAYDNYASRYNALGDFENTIKNYNMSLAIYRETEDKLNIALVLQKISKAHAERKNYDQAIEYALQALKVAEQNQLVSSSLEILPVIAHYYSSIEDHKNAFTYLDQYNRMKESDIVRNMNKIQAEYENDVRYKEEALKDAEIRQQQLVIYFSVTGLLIFICLSVVIFMRGRQLKISYQHLYNNSIEIIKKERELQEMKQKEKYSSSLLSQEDNSNLYNSLLKLMEEEQIYLNSKLTIDDVAKKLNTNRTYLSQIINEKTDTNFNNFINEYRVKEAQIRLLDDKNRSYTIEGIAQSVGFSTKSTFNGAFKKFIGLTPSEYIRMQKNEKITQL